MRANGFFLFLLGIRGSFCTVIIFAHEAWKIELVFRRITLSFAEKLPVIAINGRFLIVG